MCAALNDGLNGPAGSQSANIQPSLIETEAVTRLRWAAEVALLAEIIPPFIDATFLPRPDWLVIMLHPIWFAFTLVLLVATWHQRFGQIWKPTWSSPDFPRRLLQSSDHIL